MDVMDTLVYDPYAREQPSFFGVTWERLVQLKDPSAWVEFELGKISEEEFFRKFFADRRSFDHQGLKRTMADGYRWLDGMEALLEDLVSAGVAIHALSNYPSWYSLIEEKLHLSRFLGWEFVSCKTGVRKPDPEAYLGPARQLGRAPESFLFVDDRESNCAAARAVGLAAVRFEGAQALRENLVGRGPFEVGIFVSAISSCPRIFMSLPS